VMFQQRGSRPSSVEVVESKILDTGTAERAAAWLRGEGDLVTAAMGRPVPVAMQLGVLAHADLKRLRTLGRYSRRGSVRRTWGTEMARMAGDLAEVAGSTERLGRLQAEVLVPLELDILAGRAVWTRHHLVNHLRHRLGCPELGPVESPL
jgi:hypothetical protein